MQRISMTVIAAAVLILSGWMLFENQGEARPDRPAAAKEAEPQQADTIELQGTVVKNDLEGGFFAIEGDDGKTYDPINFDAFVKSPKNALVIPRSLRRGISTNRNHT